ncbi:matrixin family metalloprotease [Lactobacillus sp. W8093]|uniref:M57 family metalloprotease n=1 Tax=Lactobacillus sp. W8093 TaxID=2751038 RepID=UPI0018EF4520|nr:matrixin family metalloprotease [Lactobacillus sp. W8093]
MKGNGVDQGMKNMRHFLAKLACALIVVLTIGSNLPAITDNSSSVWSSQVIYAKKAKKKAKKSKNTKKKKAAAVATSWRWKKPKASVYIDLEDNQELISATNDAIEAWNKTDAFTFTKASSRKKANIVVEQVYSPNTNYAGYTTFHYYVKTGIMYSAVTRLNIYYLQNFSPYNYTYERILNTVEHELGHAIGLKHNNGVSVMYPTGSLYPIEPIDIDRVDKLYHE